MKSAHNETESHCKGGEIVWTCFLWRINQKKKWACSTSKSLSNSQIAPQVSWSTFTRTPRMPGSQEGGCTSLHYRKKPSLIPFLINRKHHDTKAFIKNPQVISNLYFGGLILHAHFAFPPTIVEGNEWNSSVKTRVLRWDPDPDAAVLCEHKT